MLVIDFWTSKGFQEHQSSYNRLVLRRSGYGTVKALLGSLAAGDMLFETAPVELVVLIQTRPDDAKYELRFALGSGYGERKRVSSSDSQRFG